MFSWRRIHDFMCENQGLGIDIVFNHIRRLVTCSENLSFKNLEGALTILCALTQKRTILFSTILFWVSAQSIVKTPSKFLKLGTHRVGEQPLKLLFWPNRTILEDNQLNSPFFSKQMCLNLVMFHIPITIMGQLIWFCFCYQYQTSSRLLRKMMN